MIDRSALFTGEGCPFPYGLLQCGEIRDEINFNTGTATSKIDRLAYSAENLATVQTYGRPYEYDTNYIYYEKAEYGEADLDDYGLDGQYDADDHGLEMFSGTPIAVYAVAVYGNSLKNKLETDVLTISAQTLTNTQKGQARTNIGAASQADLTTLNSNCTPVAFTGIEPASGFTTEHNRSFMLNGVLFIQYGARKSSGKVTASTWTTIATITDSSITLPTGNFVIPCVSIGATAAARGMINANGELQIYIAGSNDCTGGSLTGMLV